MPLLFCIIGCLPHFLSLKLWNCPIKYFVTTLLSCSVYVNVCVSSILDIVHIQFCVVKLLSERVQQVKLFILCVLFKCHWSLLLYCRHVLSISCPEALILSICNIKFYICVDESIQQNKLGHVHSVLHFWYIYSGIYVDFKFVIYATHAINFSVS